MPTDDCCGEGIDIGSRLKDAACGVGCGVSEAVEDICNKADGIGLLCGVIAIGAIVEVLDGIEDVAADAGMEDGNSGGGGGAKFKGGNGNMGGISLAR